MNNTFSDTCDICRLSCESGSLGCNDSGYRDIDCTPETLDGMCSVTQTEAVPMKARCHCPLGYNASPVYIGNIMHGNFITK